MAAKALIVLLALTAFTYASEVVESQENSGRNLWASNQSVTVGYNAFTSVIVLALGLVAIAALLMLISSQPEGYEAPATYAAEAAPAVYERVYNVFNSLREAARKYQ